MSFITPLQNVIVQKNYLEHKLQIPLRAELGFDKLAISDPIEAGIGESKTLTQRAILPPITQDVVPSPTIFTDLNNGITPQQVTYEQYTTTIAKRRGAMTLDLETDQAKIVSEYMRNWEDLAGQAAQSRDDRAAVTLYNAADAGNTYALAAGTGTTTLSVEVDNLNGFDSSYTAALAAGGSPGVPVGTSPANPLAVTIISQPSGVKTAALCVGVLPDGTNVSTAFVGGVAYGRSGQIMLQNVAGQSGQLVVNAGDVVVANDGSVVLRPNGKLSRGQLAITDLSTLSLLLRGRAKLKNRAVPRLPNGMYAAMIDSSLWSDLEQDQAFQRATAGGWGNVASFFDKGRTNSALELEFIETNQTPIYVNANGVTVHHTLLCGMGCIVKSPSIGFRRAAQMMMPDNEDKMPYGATNVRLVDDVKFVTRQALDPEATVITQTWSWQMGHVAATDITSTQAQVRTSDGSRYKRVVLIETGSAS